MSPTTGGPSARETRRSDGRIRKFLGTVGDRLRPSSRASSRSTSPSPAHTVVHSASSAVEISVPDLASPDASSPESCDDRGFLLSTLPDPIAVISESARNQDDLPPVGRDNVSPAPAVEDAIAAAEASSRAHGTLSRVSKGLVQLVKRVEPMIDGTPFKIPFQVANVLIEVFEAIQDIDAIAKTTLKNLSELLGIIEKNLLHTTDDEAESRGQKFARFLVRIAVELQKIKGSSPFSWRKVLETDECKAKVIFLIGQVDAQTTAFHVDVSLATERDTKAIMAILQDTSLHDWPFTPSAVYKSDVGENLLQRQKCTTGTRVDVLARIVAWAVDPSSPPIFWLSGPGGAGKSTIAYTVCDYFDKSDLRARLCASFFCSRQVGELRQLQNVVPTIAYQLARSSCAFAQRLSTADRRARGVSSEHVEKFLCGPWAQSAKERSDKLPPSLVVIDALDEIDSDGGAKLLKKLIEAGNAAHGGMRGLKILVTSRPHPDIAAASTLGISQDAAYRLQDIEAEDGRSDVRKYLASALPILEDKHSQELDSLSALSDGLFIFAATAVRIICPNNRRPATIQAHALSHILKSGGSLSAINSLYDTIIHDAIQEDERAQCFPILHAIVSALEPLSVDALAELIASERSEVDVSTARYIVDGLHAVLYERNGLIYIYHKSFSDFLLDQSRAGPEFACLPDKQNVILSRGCLRVMDTSLRFNICALPSSYLLDSEIEGLKQTVKDTFANLHGLEYACRYWTSHLTKVLPATEDGRLLRENLMAFCDQKVLFWIEAMSLLGKKADCNRGVHTVIGWANKVVSCIIRHANLYLKRKQPGKDPENAALLQSLRAVSLLCMSFQHTPASKSTPHLYISALATEFATNPDVPMKWRNLFPHLPSLCCTGASNHGGALVSFSSRGPVTSVAFSPDGAFVVSGSQDMSVRIWDAVTGNEMRKLDGHTSWVNSVAFSPSGMHVVSGSKDSSVRIWDVPTGNEVRKLNGHTDSVNSVAFSPDGTRIVSGSQDKSVRIWDASTGSEVRTLNGHADSVKSAAFSPDGTHVVSGSYDRSVRIWDASTGNEVRKLDGHTSKVSTVAFSFHGMRVVSGSHDKSVRIWDMATGNEVDRLDGHTSWVNSISLSSDGTRIVSGSQSNSVRIWDAATGNEVRKLDGHTSWVTSVAFSPDSMRFLSGSEDHSVCIWDASTGSEARKLSGHTGSVNSVAFSPDGTCIVSGSRDNSVRIWDALTGDEVRKLNGHTNFVLSVAFSPDGARVVSSSHDNSVRIWDALTGNEVRKLSGHTGSVNSVAFSPNCARIISGSGSWMSTDSSVRIWDASTGNEVYMLHGHTDFVLSVAFSPDGVRAVSGSRDNSARIWDTSTGNEVLKLNGHAGSVNSVAFSLDGTRIVSGSGDQSVRIWDASTGSELRKLSGHMDSVVSVAFSPDGTRVVSGSGIWMSTDNSVRIWDASTGNEVRKLNGHAKSVKSVSFSPDGARVVSGSDDKSLHIWAASTGDEVRALDDSASLIDSAAFSPDRARDVFESDDCSALVQEPSSDAELQDLEWKLDPSGWLISVQGLTRLLFLPNSLHVGLHTKYTVRVISQDGHTTVDFSNARLGPYWAQCYEES